MLTHLSVQDPEFLENGRPIQNYFNSLSLRESPQETISAKTEVLQTFSVSLMQWRNVEVSSFTFTVYFTINVRKSDKSYNFKYNFLKCVFQLSQD
jgi:hypothetical protein